MLNIKDIVIKINQGISYKEAEKLIRENVEYHTEAALKAVAEKVKLTNFAQEFLQEGASEAIDKQSILTAYPLENIK